MKKWYWNYQRQDRFTLACELKRRFHHELKGVSVEQIDGQLCGWDYEFYKKGKVDTSIWMRLTLPLAVITTILLVAFSPVKFILTGKWRYENDKLANWMRVFY
jgi:hypothetical protein